MDSTGLADGCLLNMAKVGAVKFAAAPAEYPRRERPEAGDDHPAGRQDW